MMEKDKELVLDEGYFILEEGISKLRKILGGSAETKIDANELMRYYDCVYSMCIIRLSPRCHQLYEMYRRTLEDCITSQLLPRFTSSSDELLLQALVKAWLDYKALVRGMVAIFSYVDRYYVPRASYPSLNEVAMKCFGRLVFPALNEKLALAVNSMIDREREGHHIDADLLKDVSCVVMNVGEEVASGFRKAIIDGCFTYYSQKAAKMASQLSLFDYSIKARECLDRENRRLSCYFEFLSEHERQSLLTDIKNHMTEAISNRLNNSKQVSNKASRILRIT